MMYILKMLLGLLLTGGFLLCKAEDCNRDELKRCRDTAINILESTNGRLTKSMLDSHCRTARDTLNCMLHQTPLCLENGAQNNKSEIIVKSWRYLNSVCDSYADWWANPCFQKDGIKRCETLLDNSRSLDTEACRSYTSFRECVNNVVTQCRQDDVSLLGVYLLEKGQEKAWRCPLYPDLSLVPTEHWAADSPQSSARECMMALATDTVKCRDDLEKVQQKALPLEDKNEREKLICCATFNAKTCIQEVVKQKCSEGASQAVESVFSQLKNVGIPCKDEEHYNCSGARTLSLAGGWLIPLLSLVIILIKS